MGRTQADTHPVSKVPLFELTAQFASIRSEVEAAIKQVCDSQRFILGPEVEALEEEIAQYCHSAHAVGTSSGTDALLLALMALGTGPGDEVITTAFTFFATAGTVSRLGARPVFCDIDPQTFNLDSGSVQTFVDKHCDIESGQLVNRSTGGRVRVLMPVHLYGQCAEMATLLSLAREHGLHVVEDAAQAIGAQDSEGNRAGSAGDIACFSFFPTKNLGAFGDAGMCVTNDAELANKMRILRVHGGERQYYHAVVGGNFRLDAMQAAVLSVKLKYLDGWTAKRQKNAAYYDQRFSELRSRITTPVVRPGCRHIFNQYTIRVPDRDALQDRLRRRNIGSAIYYALPLHLQECFENLGHRKGDLPQAEAAADAVLSLPIYPELTTGQLEYVADAVCDFLAS